MLAITMLLLPILALVATVHAQGSFSTPPANGAVHDYSENPIYQVGQKLDLAWDSDWKQISLWLWQNDNPNAEVLLSNTKNTGKLSWQIKTNKDYSAQSGTNGTVFFFQVAAAGTEKGQFGSHYFNLTGPNSASSTASSPPASTTVPANNLAAGNQNGNNNNDNTAATTTSSPSSSTQDATTIQVAAPPPTSTDASTGNHDASAANTSPSPAASVAPKDNSGLAAGLGVAFGLVFAALVGAVIYIVLRRRRRNRQLAQQHEELANGSQGLRPPAFGAGAVDGTKAMPPPIYANAGGYYSTSRDEKPPLPMPGSGPVELMDQRPVPPYSAAVPSGGSPVPAGAMRVHEMPGAGTNSGGGVRRISGVYEMPVHTRGNSNGIFNEEG